MLHRIATFALAALIITGAAAQTKTPTQGTAQTLHMWPVTGIWQTALARREDQTLGCIMLSGHKENGTVTYLAGIRQMPKELSILVGDLDKIAVSGDHIGLVIDGVEVGNFVVTRRVDDKTPYHSVGAAIPDAETQRVINLFRTGGDVKFVTDQATFDFPLKGAAAGIANMHECILEAVNLTSVAK